MTTTTTTHQGLFRTPLPRPMTGPFCRKCGAAMVEADRITENGCTYIWYECRSFGCGEQWLTKKAARMM